MTIAKKTYYLDDDRKLTTDQSKAAFIVVNEGQEITPDILDKHPELAVHEKAMHAPAANKAETPKTNK